jgi:hypothetical protein
MKLGFGTVTQLLAATQIPEWVRLRQPGAVVAANPPAGRGQAAFPARKAIAFVPETGLISPNGSR